VETCKSKKKEEPNVAFVEATTQASKPPRSLNYPCHICKIVSHKLMNCRRFGEMQNMFKDKGGQTTKTKPTIKVKVVITSINMVGVNVIIQSKINEK